MENDADEIIKNLWMGAAPPRGGSVLDDGFTVIVLRAEEFQPEANEFPGVKEVIHAGFDDTNDPPPGMFDIAEEAATLVAHYVRAGEKVLVTCMAGLNRSGLVTAWALHKLKGWPGGYCLHTVREKRKPNRRVLTPYDPAPLCNKAFQKRLQELDH